MSSKHGSLFSLEQVKRNHKIRERDIGREGEREIDIGREGLTEGEEER